MTNEDQNGADFEPLSAEDLRKFSGSFTTGVVVLTTRGKDGALYGLTMNAVSCVCLEPPLFLACVDSGSATLARLMETGTFALNILSRDQEAISNTFASKGADKFTNIEHSQGSLGMPLITGALASAEFRLTETHEVGDHVIVVGEAVASATAAGEPLGYFRGKYARVEL